MLPNDEETLTDEELDALLDESGDGEEQLEEDAENEEVGDIDDDGEEVVEPEPSLTYRFDFETGEIVGRVDNEQSIRQFIVKTLFTEREAHEIYSSDYGSEIYSILAEQEDADYTATEIERVVEEALEIDDRIISVNTVSINAEDDRLYITVDVNTTFGEITTEVDLI